MATPTRNENSVFYLTAAFFDKDGAAMTPSSVDYWISCLTTDTVVLAETGLTPGETIEIEILSSQNDIVDDDHDEEVKVLTVKVVSGGKTFHGEYKWITQALWAVA